MKQMTPDELRTMCRATVSDIFDAIPVLLDQGDIAVAIQDALVLGGVR